MSKYNKLRIRTLKVFAFAPGAWFKPGEVADRLDFVPPRAVWTYLKRLWRFGLLERHTSENGTLRYKISEAYHPRNSFPLSASRFARLRISIVHLIRVPRLPIVRSW